MIFNFRILFPIISGSTELTASSNFRYSLKRSSKRSVDITSSLGWILRKNIVADSRVHLIFLWPPIGSPGNHKLSPLNNPLRSIVYAFLRVLESNRPSMMGIPFNLAIKLFRSNSTCLIVFPFPSTRGTWMIL